MTTGFVAALLGLLLLGFEEALRNYYPSRATWRKLRSRHGRRAVRAMRRRVEDVATGRGPRLLAMVLLGLLILWVAAASLLDKRWYEVVLDVLPGMLVAVAMARASGALAHVALRIRDYERELGEDPDGELDGGRAGPEDVAL